MPCRLRRFVSSAGVPGLPMVDFTLLMSARLFYNATSTWRPFSSAFTFTNRRSHINEAAGTRPMGRLKHMIVKIFQHPVVRKIVGQAKIALKVFARHCRTVFHYYLDHADAFRQYAIDMHPLLGKYEDRQRDIRLSRDEDYVLARFDDKKWFVTLPESCVVCDLPTERGWNVEDRMVDDMSRPLWSPFIGLFFGIALWLYSGWFSLVLIGFFAGMSAGHRFRRKIPVRIRFRRCERHIEAVELPELRIYNRELIVRVGRKEIRKAFMNEYDMFGKLFGSQRDTEPPRPVVDRPPLPLAEGSNTEIIINEVQPLGSSPQQTEPPAPADFFPKKTQPVEPQKPIPLAESTASPPQETPATTPPADATPELPPAVASEQPAPQDDHLPDSSLPLADDDGEDAPLPTFEDDVPPDSDQHQSPSTATPPLADTTGDTLPIPLAASEPQQSPPEPEAPKPSATSFAMSSQTPLPPIPAPQLLAATPNRPVAAPPQPPAIGSTSWICRECGRTLVPDDRVCPVNHPRCPNFRTWSKVRGNRRHWEPIGYRQIFAACLHPERVLLEAIVLMLNTLSVLAVAAVLYVVFLYQDFLLQSANSTFVATCTLMVIVSLVTAVYFGWTKIYLLLVAGICLLIAIQEPIRAWFFTSELRTEGTDPLLATELLVICALPLGAMLTYGFLRCLSLLCGKYMAICRRTALSAETVDPDQGGLTDLRQTLEVLLYGFIPGALVAATAGIAYVSHALSADVVHQYWNAWSIFSALCMAIYLPMGMTSLSLTGSTNPFRTTRWLVLCWFDYIVCFVALLPIVALVSFAGWSLYDFIGAEFPNWRVPITAAASFLLLQYPVVTMADMTGLIARRNEHRLGWYEID